MRPSIHPWWSRALMPSNSALLSDAFRLLRCAYGAAKRERYVPSVTSRLTLFLSTVLACGCVPIPHTVEVTPKIEGVLSSEVGPVSGAEVRLTQNLSDVVCAKAEHTTYTDAAG